MKRLTQRRREEIANFLQSTRYRASNVESAVLESGPIREKERDRMISDLYECRDYVTRALEELEA